MYGIWEIMDNRSMDRHLLGALYLRNDWQGVKAMRSIAVVYYDINDRVELKPSFSCN